MRFEISDISTRILEETAKVVKGQEEFIRMLLVCLFAGGHVLIEGVPGLGKTLSTRVLAAISDVEFKRIQFTPDMMPSDVTGNNIFDMNDRKFHLRKGPIFTNFLLADEINRTPPRTQSALLEAMEEKSVTIDGKSYELNRPFMVLATQNPIEFEGTYPLPEAQLDRFTMKLNIDYPDEASEKDILTNYINGFDAGSVEEMGLPVIIDRAWIGKCREQLLSVRVDDSILSYIVAIVRATRNSPALVLGASPRASVALMQTSKVLAAMEGRNFVIPEDIKRLVVPILRHRIILTPESEIDGIDVDHAILTMVEGIKVPR